MLILNALSMCTLVAKCVRSVSLELVSGVGSCEFPEPKRARPGQARPNPDKKEENLCKVED